MTESSQILLVGYGNMGRALVRGWLEQGRPAGTIAVIDAVAAARAAAAADGLSIFERDAPSIRPRIAVLAVKPQQLSSVLGEHAATLRQTGVVLSIIAGKRIGALEAQIGREAAIVRAMPNTPAAIGQGMTVLCANSAVSSSERNECEALMRAVGAVEWVDDEALMDAVTAVSGSGPAYVFLLIECLASAGVEMGLSADLAMKLAMQTVSGSGAYARSADDTAAELRRKVTSPGGTTEAALQILLAEDGLPALMAAAVRAATRRSRELSSE